jgi:flagella basal body P-ring formation protein FlgA
VSARWLLLLATGCCAAAVAAAPVRITLLPDVKLAGDTVLLGEVAHLHGGDLDMLRKLVHLPVGRAPQPGQVGVLRREGLVHWMQQQAGVAPEAVEWSGAAESRVQRTLRRVAGDEIAQAALAAVRDALAAAGVAAQLQVRSAPRDLELAGGDVRLQARPLDGLQLRRRAMVWVDLRAGDSVLRSVPVGVDIAPQAGPLVIAGSPASVALPAETPAVARGEWAVLRTSAGAVALETRVEVLQDGRPGDKVRVRQPGAIGPMFARVTGAGQLELAP